MLVGVGGQDQHRQAQRRSALGERPCQHLARQEALGPLGPPGRLRAIEPGVPVPIDEPRRPREDALGHVELHGLFHARKLALHQFAIERLAWDHVHKALRLTKPFYGWFTPAIAASDFVLRTAEQGADLDRALDFVAVVRP